MQRTVLLFVIVGALLAIAAGTALAVVESGGPGNDTLVGTNRSDALAGNDGDDDIFGRGAGDSLSGGNGSDDIFAGAGKDSIAGDVGNGGGFTPDGATQPPPPPPPDGPGDDFIDDGNDGVRDTISCGPGDDTVRADPIDVVASDCEDVTRR